MASLTLSEVEKLLMTTETFRVERTISTSDTDKFCEAICSFANDMPDSRAKGYLFVGVYDDGRRAGLRVTDKLLTDEGLLQQQAVESARIALRSGEIATRGVKGERILRVFDIISQNNEITLSALSDAVSLSKRTVSGYVEEMKGMGILTREGGTYGGRWKTHAPLKVRSKQE